MNRDDEVQTREDRTEAEHKHAHHDRNDASRFSGCAVGGIESPSRIEATREQCIHREECAGDPEVVAEEIQARERNVLRAEHDRKHKVSKRTWNARDDDQENHDRAVQRERLVVLIGIDPTDLSWREQLRAHDEREEAAHEEGGEH